MLVDGVELSENSASVADFQSDYVLKGGSVDIPVKISNDGRQLSASQKGMNIVMFSDGRTVKVMVK